MSNKRKLEVGIPNVEHRGKGPINDTDYCRLWSRVYMKMSSGGVAAIELIEVKELGTEEIRFTYYIEESDGSLRFIPRPLDLPPSELSVLLQHASEVGLIKFNNY